LNTKLDCSKKERKKERKQSSKQAIHDDHVAHVVPKGAALYSVAAATRDQRRGNLSWKNISIIIIIFLVQSKTTMKYTRVCRIDICISCMWIVIRSALSITLFV
jgi:hypothetical protein